MQILCFELVKTLTNYYLFTVKPIAWVTHARTLTHSNRCMLPHFMFEQRIKWSCLIQKYQTKGLYVPLSETSMVICSSASNIVGIGNWKLGQFEWIKTAENEKIFFFEQRHNLKRILCMILPDLKLIKQKGKDRNTSKQVQYGLYPLDTRCVQCFPHIVYVHLWTLNASGYGNNGFSLLFALNFPNRKKRQYKLPSRQYVCVCKRCIYAQLHIYIFFVRVYSMLGCLPDCLYAFVYMAYSISSAFFSSNFLFDFNFNFVPFLWSVCYCLAPY